MLNRPTPKILRSPFHHQDDPPARHLPDATTHGTRRSPGKSQPPGQWAEPALWQIEHGGFPVPPADEQLKAGRHEPEGRIELERELRLD